MGDDRGEVKKYDDYDGYEKYEDAADEWRWRQRDDNNRVIAEGGEGYETEQGVDRAVANVVQESSEAAG
jgi:uncharacterized protein YegP (UPF0339 family)